MADIGTRKGCTIDDIRPDSKFITGDPDWMNDDPQSFPVKKIEEMLLSEEELKIARSEMSFGTDADLGYLVDELCAVTRYVDEQTAEVYQFS